MKAFVTGATGFLGSTLVDQLLQEGHEVVCLVRRSSNLQWLVGKPVRLVYGNLSPDHPAFQEGLQKADWFFHVAGLLSTANPQDYYQVNVEGTRVCLDACLKHAPALQRFVFVSSLAACGPASNGQLIDENTFPNPMTEYGKS